MVIIPTEPPPPLCPARTAGNHHPTWPPTLSLHFSHGEPALHWQRWCLSLPTAPSQHCSLPACSSPNYKRGEGLVLTPFQRRASLAPMQMCHLCPELPLCKSWWGGVAEKCQEGPGSPPQNRNPTNTILADKKASMGEFSEEQEHPPQSVLVNCV